MKITIELSDQEIGQLDTNNKDAVNKLISKIMNEVLECQRRAKRKRQEELRSQFIDELMLGTTMEEVTPNTNAARKMLEALDLSRGTFK